MKTQSWSPLLMSLLPMGLSLGACGEDDAMNAAPASETPATAGAGEPTFWQDVAPILNDKCTACHQTGGIAPFALDNFADAERRATLIADMTASRIMPPYLMDVGGACGSFDESTALTDAEIATIGAWAGGAHAEGTPVEMTPPVAPSLATGTDVFTPEFVPQIAGGVLAQFDEYRCFPIELGLTDDAFVTGFEFQPGNTAIVHHVIATLVDPSAASSIEGLTNAQVEQQLNQDDREGWPCFSGAGDGIRVENATGAWAPGAGPYTFPEGIGVRVRPGRQLVVQVHYNLANAEVRGQSDRTRVRLQLANSVERQAGLLLKDAFLGTLARNPPDVLAPGNPAAQYSWTLRGAGFGLVPGVPVEVLTVAPHMHQRGRKYTVEFGRDDAFECMGHVARWDFNWQRFYRYLTPPMLDADSQIRVSCEYDTSDDTQPVLPGWGTRNEMCEVTMVVAYPPGVVF
jgi:Copper type II ascorbate-dependent monooxygenase, C-terminal domain